MKHRSILRLMSLMLAAHLCGVADVSAQSVPAGFNDASVMNGWSEPVGFTFDPAGRMYVWEKQGKVWIVENGVRLAAPLVDISPEVGNWRDHGCLGFALDPNFTTNGYIYLLYAVDRHHLLYFGTGSYNAGTNEYLAATIMRITRYTAIGPAHNVVDYNSRLVLLGESKQTGVPMLHESHSTGSLVFGTDGTLMVTLGDGASYSSTDVGSAGETYYVQALNDGIIRPEENVGAMRSQMVNSLNGKLLRLDPATGNGVPSNPFYDPAKPRDPRSRVWCLGLRNPFRMALRPGSGSVNPADGDPGTLYIGDVGWNKWEDLNVAYEAGMNFGWPLYEGMEPLPEYQNANTANLDAPNPLYDGVTCTQQYFLFEDLLKQDTPVHLNGHPNACNAGVQIPATIPHFFHARPAIDWRHGTQSRCGAFSGSAAITYDLNAPGSPVVGPLFGGNTSVGGTWFTGTNWPAGYQNVYFNADYGQGWIKLFRFDGSDLPINVENFASAVGAVVFVTQGPDGCLWYVRYDTGDIRRICYTGSANLPPVAVIGQSVQYGPGPLGVSFTGSTSTDPENQPLSYSWTFGDGGTSTTPDPFHVFLATPGVPTMYTVTLTVTDNMNQTNATTRIVSVNNTPPVVDINSFADGATYPVGVDSTFTLSAAVSDAEHTPAQLTYAWRTIFHHNTHTHPEPLDNTPVTSTVISGVGCDGNDYSYEIQLTVTDAAGLSTTDINWLYPRCYAIPPTALMEASVIAGEGPLAVVFDASDSYDPGSIVNYAWTFGDGATASGVTTSHVFTDPNDYYVTLTVTDNDGLTGQAQKTISVITFDPPQCVGASGSIMRQFWSNVSGSTVNDLLSSPNYPNNPTSTNYPTSFGYTANIANNYGTRMRGYIIAPETGTYNFTICSDDASVFYISLNAQPQYKQVACTVPGWTNENEYAKYPSQRSANINLVAGRYYYVEFIQKEGSGGDHLSVFWQRPSNQTITLIGGAYLARWQDCPPSVRLRANLQGPYDLNTGLMKDDLRVAGFIPTGEPFTALGFTQTGGGGGETVSGATLSTTGANAIVDWVLVEIRNKNNPAQILATRSALLQRDGDVVGTNGYGRILFASLAYDNYFVALRHRNHFGCMTFASTALTTNEVLIDLTLGTTSTYGTDARVVLANGKRALWAGNSQRDNLIKYTGTANDRDPILSDIGGLVPTNTVTGYRMTDVTMDGVTKYTGTGNDRDVILQCIGGIVPTNTRAEQLP